MSKLKMIIRDGHAYLNNDKTTFECASGTLDIVGPDGRSLFDLTIHDDGSLEISANSCVCVNDTLLDDGILVKPRAANHIIVRREVYEG